MNTTQLLTDPDQLPDNKLFEDILSKQLLHTYLQIENIVSALGLNAEWRYYHDGKAWLCKITNKKKTIAWLSLWNDCIKTSFYFTEKRVKESFCWTSTMILKLLSLSQKQSGS